MRFIRLTALVISLGLLVATVTSVVHRRVGELASRDARVEQAASSVATSARAMIAQLEDEAALTARIAEREGSADGELAADLAEVLPSADVCVGADAGDCVRADLFSLPEVADLVARSRTADGPGTSAAVDAGASTILVVAPIPSADASSGGAVALRYPLDGLVAPDAAASVDPSVDVSVAVVATTADGDRPGIATVDGRRRVVERIDAPFADGSLEVTAVTEASIGIAGDQIAGYVLLLALGTVLLALAGWTFKLERRQLERRATTDELTGLVNRREFERISEEQLDIADRFSTGLCVMVIDLNGFKQVNDTLGHQFGDLVLSASSERLVAAVRDTDVVGRWGGDEFVILLPGLIERTAVRDRAERIWEMLASSPVVGETTMTASIGAAIFPRHGTTLDALMRAADVAMYEAKTTGVGHRIADTIAVGEALLADGIATAVVTPEHVVTAGYEGPDRRHSPVPPPPAPPSPPARAWSDRVLATHDDLVEEGPVGVGCHDLDDGPDR